MANTFKRYKTGSIGTSTNTVYTVPANTTAVVLGVHLTNRDTANSIEATVTMAGVYLLRGAPIPVGSALSALDGKIILEAGDTVTVNSDTATSIDVIISVMEQT